MKSKEEVKDIISSAPTAKSYRPEHHRVSNITAGRVFAWLLILSGLACVLLTGVVYHALPFLLGGLMVVLGLNRFVCGIWTKEYQTKETKLTANGIVYFTLGVVILCHYRDADAVIGSIWGFLGLMKGSEAINSALYSLSHKGPFVGEGLQGAVELALGILLLVDPASAVEHHVFLLGLELVAVGWQILREMR